MVSTATGRLEAFFLHLRPYFARLGRRDLDVMNAARRMMLRPLKLRLPREMLQNSHAQQRPAPKPSAFPLGSLDCKGRLRQPYRRRLAQIEGTPPRP